jgi:Tfp pilus assembly protein PilF
MSHTARRVHRPVRSAVAAVTLLLLAVPALAQEWKGRGRLQGQVVDPEGEPVQGAKVSLHSESADGPGPEPLTTSKKGRWSYLGLASGSWVIVVETDEYIISEGTVQVNEFGPPGQPIRIQLKEPTPEMRQSQAVDLVAEGNALLEQGKYAEARARYEEALPEIAEQNRPALRRGIAQAHLQEGHPEEALEILESLLEEHPDDATTLKLIISVLLQEGRDEEARPYIERLPEEEKLDLDTRLNMGIEHYNAGEHAAALEQFQKALADYPGEPEVYYYRGLNYLGMGKNEDALADLQKFLELAPDSPKAAEAEEFISYLESQ